MEQTRKATLEKVGSKWVLTSGDNTKEFKSKKSAKEFYYNLPVASNIDLLLTESEKTYINALGTMDANKKKFLLKYYEGRATGILEPAELKANKYMISVIKNSLS